MSNSIQLSGNIASHLVPSCVAQVNTVFSQIVSFGWHSIKAQRHSHRQMARAMTKRKLAALKASKKDDAAHSSVSGEPKVNLFLTLPPEIRLMVYQLLFRQRDFEHFEPSAESPSIYSLPCDTQPLHLATLRTCKIIDVEASPIFYSHLLYIDSVPLLSVYTPNRKFPKIPLRHWCEQIRPCTTECVRRVR